MKTAIHALAAVFTFLTFARIAEAQHEAKFEMVDLNQYKITKIQLPDAKAMHITAMNNRGQIVGYFTTSSDRTHSFLWDKGKTIDLGILDGSESRAYGINDKGQIVGCISYMDGSSIIRQEAFY